MAPLTCFGSRDRTDNSGVVTASNGTAERRRGNSMQDHTARPTEQAATNWETLARLQHAVVRRRGRFIVVDLAVPHRTLSTSTRNGGQSDEVRHLVNHQSCEATGHDARFEYITGQGMEAYHAAVCKEVGLADRKGVG